MNRKGPLFPFSYLLSEPASGVAAPIAMAGFLFQAFEPEDRGILGMAYTSTDRHSVKAAILALAHGERVVCVHGFLGGNSGENLRENSAEGGGICTG